MALLSFQFPLTWLTIAYITCSLVSKAQPVDESEDRKCERAFFSSAPSSTFKCTYTCKGWPIRSENEPDGIRCGLIRKTGVCRGGKCVSADDDNRPPNDAIEVSSTTVSTEQMFPTAARLVFAGNDTSDVPSTEDSAITARVTTKDEELVTKMETINATLLAAKQGPTAIPSTNEPTTAVNEGLISDDVKRPPNDTYGEYSPPVRTEKWVATTARLMAEVNATFEVPSTKDTVTTSNNTTEVIQLVTELVTENATALSAEYRTTQEPRTEETSAGKEGLTSDYTASTQGSNDSQHTSATTEPDVLTREPSEASPVKSEALLPSSSTPSGSYCPVLCGGILSAILFCSLVLYGSSNFL